ncbi:MAG: hypothetical protein FWD75_05270 [Propionibacteriaceae bacterium]|nr:hypothetical protein [Propionibacteriaceae bacterium]
MKRFFFLLLLFLGIGALLYVSNQRHSEARQLWEEALAKVPTPERAPDES